MASFALRSFLVECGPIYLYVIILPLLGSTFCMSFGRTSLTISVGLLQGRAGVGYTKKRKVSGTTIASATVGGLKSKCALYVLKKQNHSWMEPLIYHD